MVLSLGVTNVEGKDSVFALIAKGYSLFHVENWRRRLGIPFIFSSLSQQFYQKCHQPLTKTP